MKKKSDKCECVKVAIRVRPMNKHEKEENSIKGENFHKYVNILDPFGYKKSSLNNCKSVIKLYNLFILTYPHKLKKLNFFK